MYRYCDILYALHGVGLINLTNFLTVSQWLSGCVLLGAL